MRIVRTLVEIARGLKCPSLDGTTVSAGSDLSWQAWACHPLKGISFRGKQ